MSDNSNSVTPRFNAAATLTARSAEIQERVDNAMKRMNDHFEKCEPALTQSRYRDLLTKQGNAPELKPPHAHENPQDRMMKAARQWVRFDHLNRLNKIRNVGERMIGKDRALER